MRKDKIVTITAEGRDQGKKFLITEMPAIRAEKWAAKALLAVAASGVELPDDVSGAGIAGVAVMGLKSLGKVKFEDLEPLLDEMMDCVQFKPDRADMPARALFPEDIEEVATLVELRKEVIELHVGFSLADGKLNINSIASAKPSFQRKTSRAQSHRS